MKSLSLWHVTPSMDYMALYPRRLLPLFSEARLRSLTPTDFTASFRSRIWVADTN
jgi:hypothetical protein